MHYLPDKIKDFLGSGDDYGINIKYVIEKEPLGTAGCLSLIQDSLSGNNLVVNADVLTDIDYRGLLDFHTKKNSAQSQYVLENTFMKYPLVLLMLVMA